MAAEQGRPTMRCMRRTIRAAAAGAAAAGLWAATEPALRCACRTQYGDLRLVGGLLAPRSAWRRASARTSSTGRCSASRSTGLADAGSCAGSPPAELENAVLWPALALVDRRHPDVLDGTWQPLLRDRRVLAEEVAGHALFGASLGL